MAALRVDPAWLAWQGGTVPRLVRAIEADQRFEDLPILADALEEAGCAEAGLLAHCRQPGRHAAHCWVLTLLALAEWPACDDPRRLLTLLPKFLHWLSGRTMRLLACACCRRLWPLLADKRWQQAVLMAERFADGLATLQELDRASQAARLALVEAAPTWDARRAAEAAEAAASPQYNHLLILRRCADAVLGCRVEKGVAAREHELADLIRDVIGPSPFRRCPSLAPPAWLTEPLTQAARTIDDSRTWDEVAGLADALEQAGCADADVLDHCRGPGPHVRGCWVVDLLLGRE